MINTLVASLFALCFISVCFSFALRFMSVCSPLCFRYTSVMPSLCHRFVNGGRSSSQRRQIEFTTEDERRMNEWLTKHEREGVKSLSRALDSKYPFQRVSKVEKIRIGLLVGGYSIPAIPTQSTENEGRVEGVSKLNYTGWKPNKHIGGCVKTPWFLKKSQSPDFHKPGLCYV